ncbi:BspA family leucine-rich repeat surface protein [Bernardetia sp. Wsw4-3y2]|uniref:BspA family leucine-rich repeat surface protein n=1 Tax=Bernardetia sp. Wsw4-3y2 TaxID=3127471 RepID=UPI0030D4674D
MIKLYSNFRNQIKTILFGFSLLFTFFFFSIQTAEAQAFRTTWVTDDGTITIPTNASSGTYNYTVWWRNLSGGGGSGYRSERTGNYTITGLTNGATYEIAITGDFPHFSMNHDNRRERIKLRSIESWGDIAWTSMENAFYGCTNLMLNANDVPNLSGVSSLEFMFRNCTAFDASIGNWNTDSVRDMRGMFSGATSFNQPIGNWNTDSVRIMRDMFSGATSFNQPIGNWNIENVWDMANMFSGATSFNQPIGNWNTESGSYMMSMFENATSFNQPIGNWNTSNVVGMRRMFQNAISFNQNIGSWNVESIYQAPYNGGMLDMLNNSGINMQNYNSILIGWSSQSLSSIIKLGANGLTYCSATAVTARNILTSTPNHWRITGDSLSGDGAAISNTTLPQNQFDLCANTPTTLKADGNGIILWYNSSSSITPIYMGSSFTTPILTTDSTYFYVQDSVTGCGVSNRLEILVTTSSMENITPPQNQYGVCLNDTTVLEVSGNGMVYWYDSPTSTTPIHIGTRFTTPPLTQDSTYFYAFDSIVGCNNERLELLVTALSSLNAVSKTNYTAYLDATGQVEVDAILLDSISSAGCGNTIASYLYDDTGLATRSFSCADTNAIHNVVFRITDNNGNIETSPTLIHVKDTIRPVVSVRTLPVVFNVSNQATISARDFITSLSDNCTDSADISVVFNDTGLETRFFDCGTTSIRNISLRIADRAGNQVIQPVVISPSATNYDFNVNIIAGTFRPAIASTITVLTNNYSCAPKSGELKVTLPSNVTYNSASITPNRIAGNNLFWDVTDLSFDRNFVVRVSVTPNTSLIIGNRVCFAVHITPEVNDLTRLNNLKNYCFPIVNSYDPNDKQVYPQGICDEKFTKRSDLPLTYTIRFQNTGNAPALNVNIVDSLSTLLDRSSLRVVGTSHPMVVDTTANSSVINFRFDDINLHDSTSSPELSQGYVIFELDEIAAHTDTSRIENKSYIYFDTNAPIITNTVKNTILDVLPLCDPAGGSNPPIADCQLPTNLTAEALSATRVKLSWATPANSNAINYEIWRNNQLLETIVSSQLSFIDSLVSSSTQYTYSIKAICGNNTATSNFVQVRTIPSTPTLFSLEAACKGESGTIEVRSSGAVYRVYTSQDATTPLFETSNATIQTPALNDTTTFYISVIINSLESERLEVVVPIKEVFEAIVEQGSLFESCTNTFTLSANEVENASYLWFRDNIQVGNTRALVVSFEGNYTVRISKEGCFAVSEATKVVFVDAPTAKIEQGSEVTFCGNGMLNAQDTSSNVTYTWSLNGTDVGTGTSISVSESGNYTLTASQPSCLDSVSIAVTITDLPAMVLSADKTEICSSEETRLSVTTGTGFTYKWFRNDTAISNDSSTLVTFEIGTYKVEITTTEGCQVESNEIEITEAQAQNATITINRENSVDKTITVSSSDSIVSVVWFKDGTEVASFANQRTIEPTESGNYKAKVTYISGCEFETEEKAFTFDIETGIEEESAKIFTVYPNPNTGSFKVEFATTTNQKTNLVVVDALGRTIYSKEISRNEKTTTITLPKISAGVYVVQIISQGKVYTKQLVIQ